MSDQSSSLTRRVRQLLGTSALATDNGAQIIAPLQERLELIEQRLAELLEQTTHGSAAPVLEDQGSAAVREVLTSLEKQVGRVGREQLKANSLAEAQFEKFSAALDLFHASDTRRAEELELLRQQLRGDQAAARLEVIRAFLPAIDGLDEALRSGHALLEQYTPEAPVASATLFERMLARMNSPSRPDPTLHHAMSAWLVGLTFVRQRMLDALAAEGVLPIPTQGTPFDPQMHVAMEIVPSSEQLPPGIVAYELRRGYQMGERVLRHAEVAVSSTE